MPRYMGKRAEALLSGAETYFQGTVCVNGHRAPRYAHNGACVECYARIASLKPFRDWPIFKMRLHEDDHAEAARLLNELKARRESHLPR